VLRRFALLTLIGACSPTFRLANRCPTAAPLAIDFAAGTIGLAASAAEYNRGEQARSFAIATAAMLVFTGAALSECK